MLALARWEATELCPRCGGPKELCQELGARYTADAPIRCAATDAYSREQDRWRDDGLPRPEALIPQIRRTT